VDQGEPGGDARAHDAPSRRGDGYESTGEEYNVREASDRSGQTLIPRTAWR
jgi:hypothetical protein